MKYLVDSDWIIDGLKGIPAAVATLSRLGAEGLAISVVVLAEVEDGAYNEPDPQARIADIRTFLTGYRKLPVSEEVAETFARIRAELRRQGTPLADLDLLIAATALQHDLELVTRNRKHFERVPGLRLYEPT